MYSCLYAYSQINRRYIHAYMYMHGWINVYIYIYIYRYVHICMHLCIWGFIDTHMYSTLFCSSLSLSIFCSRCRSHSYMCVYMYISKFTYLYILVQIWYICICPCVSISLRALLLQAACSCVQDVSGNPWEGGACRNLKAMIRKTPKRYRLNPEGPPSYILQLFGRRGLGFQQ